MDLDDDAQGYPERDSVLNCGPVQNVWAVIGTKVQMREQVHLAMSRELVRLHAEDFREKERAVMFPGEGDDVCKVWTEFRWTTPADSEGIIVAGVISVMVVRVSSSSIAAEEGIAMEEMGGRKWASSLIPGYTEKVNVPGKVWLGREEGEVQILVLWTGPFSFRMAIMFSEKEGVCSYLVQCRTPGIPRMCLSFLEVGKTLYYNP